ncbi:ankyrin repeat domain-containing protein [Ferrimonas marina]|nr:ankyrin repeat domain-containing protein [Ferrimonas marina]
MQELRLKVLVLISTLLMQACSAIFTSADFLSAKPSPSYFVSYSCKFDEVSENNLQVFSAVRERDFLLLNELVAQGSDINFKVGDGSPLLLCALDDVEMFRELLRLGADPNVKFNGTTLLHLTAENEFVSLLSELIIFSGNIEIEDDFRATPIFSTIDPFNEEVPSAMIFLVDAGANIEHVNRGCVTVMYMAAQVGRFDAVVYLYENGASVEVTSCAGLSFKELMSTYNERIVHGSEKHIKYLRAMEIMGLDNNV